MKNIFRFFAILILFSSCYQEHTEEIVVPDKLMSEEELVNTLTDLQLAEAVITQQRLLKLTRNRAFKDSVYTVVFDHHGITHEVLTENLNYYNTDPQKMEAMYQKVLSNLSKIQSEVELATKNDTINESFIDEE